MAQLIWAPQALNDVAAIGEFIASDAPRTAQKFVQRIFDSVERLERFPFSGGIVPELGNENFREILFKTYRIIYRVRDKETVEIVTVYHCARLLDLNLLFEE